MSSSPDPGPIEYTRKADRRAAKLAAQAAARAAAQTRLERAATPDQDGTDPAAPVAGRNGRKPAAKGSALGGVLAVLGIIGLFVAYFLFAPTGRRILLGFACDVTACSAAGMTTTGWLIVAAPAASMLLIGVLWRRADRIGRGAMVAFAVLSWLVAMLVVPGRGRDLADILKGPGSEQVGDGILWGLGGAGAALAFLFLLVFVGKAIPVVDRHYNTVAVIGIAALMVAALPLAIRAADPTYTRAADVFPAVLRMNGDTLTRTALSDRRGCDGVLPDDALLNRDGCFVTVHAAYTTDDSDAVAVLRAVLYRDDESADDARARLSSGMDPVGANGDVVTVFSTTGPWVLVGAAGHADGRTVTADERNWVLWPLRQVSYHFIGTQVGLLIDPDPTDEIRPRTP
ncbi:hypothetical protein [Catellatospora sp. NPDC049609]|uniref:hypothetical protein n=1 Tax=Catellatospora sp. NPDC049609 TaxID=3155505 RepID=UPI0034495426